MNNVAMHQHEGGVAFQTKLLKYIKSGRREGEKYWKPDTDFLVC